MHMCFLKNARFWPLPIICHIRGGFDWGKNVPFVMTYCPGSDRKWV